MHMDDQKKKKTKSEKVQNSENIQIPKSRNFQTILAKFQNGRLTIIHSSLCSSCMHIDDQKKLSPKKFKIPKIFEFQNPEIFKLFWQNSKMVGLL